MTHCLFHLRYNVLLNIAAGKRTVRQEGLSFGGDATVLTRYIDTTSA